MPHLFSPYTLKDVTLRNRIGMSPMTMYQSTDGRMSDYHVMYLGARAAGGFGLVFPEQIAIVPEGRTSTSCAGIYDDDQMEGLARVCSMIKSMGGVPAIQLGHTGRKGSMVKPWDGHHQIAPDHPDGWAVSGPSAISYGDEFPHPVREMTREDIQATYDAYAEAARRAAEVGFEWLEMHYAHGYLGSSFLSPLANQRTDEYGGSIENRARFHCEAIDAVRATWPERLPLTARLGSDDLHPDGVQFEESLVALAMMRDHGLDLADISIGFNTNDMTDPPIGALGGMLSRATRVREEVGLPVATSWNLGLPSLADEAIRSEQVDLVLLGRSALANPHWPVWAARELGHEDPFGLVPEDWAWWLRNMRGSVEAIGWPAPQRDVAPV